MTLQRQITHTHVTEHASPDTRIYSKNAVKFLDKIAAEKQKLHCHLRGEMTHGYPAFVNITVNRDKTTNISFGSNSRERITKCPASMAVAYAIVQNDEKADSYKYAVAFLFDRKTNKAAYYTGFSNDASTQDVITWAVGVMAPKMKIVHFDKAGEVARLLQAAEFAIEGSLSVSEDQFLSYYRERVAEDATKLSNFVTLWPEVKELAPYSGNKWNRKDWPFLPVFVEDVSLSYSLDAVCKRTRLPSWKLAAGLNVVEKRKGVFEVFQEGDEEHDLAAIVHSCSNRMAVFSVGIEEYQKVAHSNSLIVDSLLHEIELFEPNGVVDSSEQINAAMKKYLAKHLPEYKYIPPVEFCPSLGVQQAHMLKRRKRDPDFNDGLCVTFMLLFTTYRVLNPDFQREVVLEVLMTEIEERADFIERFVTYVHNVLVKHRKP